MNIIIIILQKYRLGQGQQYEIWFMEYHYVNFLFC